MRTLVCTLMSLLLAGAVYAEPDYADLPQISNVSTGGTTSVTTNETDVTLSGYARAVVVDLSGVSSPTVDVDVATSGPFGSRTILTTNSVTADTEYRFVTEIPIIAETLKAWGSNANKTGVHVRVQVIFDRDL
jgi:hypothetical protein